MASTQRTNSPKSSFRSDNSKNKILDQPTIEAVAKLINHGKAKRIIVMAGAGLSTAAGIPDFRTPGTGLYDNLQKYNLPYPEAIFDIGYFKEQPEPFFELARELFPGKFLPTLAHYFLVLLHRKTLLYRCFTQNIDTLESLAGLPEDMVVEAHGSFSKSKCLRCKKLVDIKWMKDIIDKVKVPKCDSCNGIVKPCITFFGETLPDNFFRRLLDFQECDLLIVIGTSLQVQPFAGLIETVGAKTPRLLINLEKVGIDMGFEFDDKNQKYHRDAFYEGTCDEGVKKLAELCGWKDELLQLYEEGRSSLIKQYGPSPTTVDIITQIENKTKAEQKTGAEEAVDQLTKEFEDKIKIKSEISVEVDQMLKEFEKVKLEQSKSDEEELLNEEKYTVKLDEKKEELIKESKENKNIEENKKFEENKNIEEKKVEENKNIEENKKFEENKSIEENKKFEENKNIEENKKFEENKNIEEKKVEDNKKIEEKL